MEPHHHHEHSHRLTSLNKAFIIGIALNITFVIVEFGVGFYYNSLGLLSDDYVRGDDEVPYYILLLYLIYKKHLTRRLVHPFPLLAVLTTG